MTENEAIQWLKHTRAYQYKCDNCEYIDIKGACNEECKDFYDMAIQALEEIQQYRAIGTIEELKALKEKNEPKKPTPIDYEKYIGIVENAKFLKGACWCPNCEHTVRSGTYCDDCGQALDWGE